MKPCIDVQPWLGNESIGMVTLIDTPGLGLNASMDAATMSSIVKLLKDLKHVHVFILAYKENDHRATQEMKYMLEYLIEVFGSNIWNYAILEATHWSYEKKQMEIRAENNRTEKSWAQRFNTFFSREFKLRGDFTLPAVFIDSFHTVFPEDAFQRAKFEENAEKLWKFANSRKNTPYTCNDIEVLLNERALMEQSLHNLTALKAAQELNLTLTQMEVEMLQDKVGEKDVIIKTSYTLETLGLCGGLSLILGLFIGIISTAICASKFGEIGDFIAGSDPTHFQVNEEGNHENYSETTVKET
ncbi:uncharacterized protein LOC111706183 isoform X1 [Eurytemora carolleeae]|uniref:uncharacterized protein LOC111706183 isoform X1 n=2 Tax=Eurytemora carolleeae TaxID=1294199 RepID=UPI000C789EC6|nr:uncharacterized protein LOC111706183 isoform X1 [Eurytemora carolleeae]XP_023334745.1 uncharacterized protein LOC111706183 isoform X1 [Eurytemora carolleeae]|eukprot:XP_023334744.1 uncharacterized protein LOC111706183 isoform X1 [Eurytemora affinis]